MSIGQAANQGGETDQEQGSRAALSVSNKLLCHVFKYTDGAIFY